jgi:hypothetical protein
MTSATYGLPDRKSVRKHYDPRHSARPVSSHTYASDDPVNGSDPTGLYKWYSTLASTNVDGVYAALNLVSTGRSANVQPGMVRIQFQISARSIEQKAAMDSITASIRNVSLGGAPAYDSTNALDPIQYTAHPSVLAWPGNKITAYGVFTGSLVPFETQTITFIGLTYAPPPTEQPWAQEQSYTTQVSGNPPLTSSGTNSPWGACGVLV